MTRRDYVKWWVDALDACERRRFPQHRLQVCASIPPQAHEGVTETIASRFRKLAGPLPLVGDIAMRPALEGGIHLIEAIRAEAPWYEPALSTLERQLALALRTERPWLQWRPLLLVGPPGSGKSHLARLLAGHAGGASATLNLGGSDDTRTLQGTARAWSSSEPCWPAVMINRHEVANPVLTGEEIDKVDVRRSGRSVYDVLLTMIERSTARGYWDEALQTNIDLSAVCWIFTANDVSKVPAPFLSRVDVVAIDGPKPMHFDLVMASVRRELAAEWCIPESVLPHVPARLEVGLRELFGRTRSVRALSRHVEDALAAMMIGPGLRPH